MQINGKDMLLLDLRPIMIADKKLIMISKYCILKLYITLSLIYT